MNIFPVLITLVAGLATVAGSVFISNKRNSKTEAFALAFATGLMLMISLGELIPQSFESLGTASLLLVVCGAFLSLVLDVVLPHHHDDEDMAVNKQPGHYIDECECSHHDSVSKGMIAALLLHNILEGMATGVTAFSNTRLGANMALGIAIHNIPIGATLAITLVSAGKTKKTAVFDSAVIGLSQALGAVAGLVFYKFTSNPVFLASCNAVVAGILIFIAFDELWPAARNNGKRNLNIAALMLGICFIPLTELI